MADADAADKALADYIEARLEQLGPSFADAEVVHEALTLHRDLWAALFEIDRDAALLANPS